MVRNGLKISNAAPNMPRNGAQFLHGGASFAPWLGGREVTTAHKYNSLSKVQTHSPK